MKIKLAATQAGSTGDFVASSLGAAGNKHFVSPVVSYASGGLLLVNEPVLNPFVELEASSSADFAKNFEWVGATPVGGQAHKARVSRSAPGHFIVQIKKKQDGSITDVLHVWIVQAVCTPKGRSG